MPKTNTWTIVALLLEESRHVFLMLKTVLSTKVFCNKMPNLDVFLESPLAFLKAEHDKLSPKLDFLFFYL